MAFLYNVRIDYIDGSFSELESVEGVNFREGSVSFLFERLKGVELYKKMITVPFNGVKTIDTTIVGIIPELEGQKSPEPLLEAIPMDFEEQKRQIEKYNKESESGLENEIRNIKER